MQPQSAARDTDSDLERAVVSVVKCPPFPTWKGLQPNSTEKLFRVVLNYTCARDVYLADNSTWKLTRCNASAAWHPPVIECKRESTLSQCGWHVSEFSRTARANC